MNNDEFIKKKKVIMDGNIVPIKEAEKYIKKPEYKDNNLPDQLRITHIR